MSNRAITFAQVLEFTDFSQRNVSRETSQITGCRGHPCARRSGTRSGFQSCVLPLSPGRDRPAHHLLRHAAGRSRIRPYRRAPPRPHRPASSSNFCSALAYSISTPSRCSPRPAISKSARRIPDRSRRNQVEAVMQLERLRPRAFDANVLQPHLDRRLGQVGRPLAPRLDQRDAHVERRRDHQPGKPAPLPISSMRWARPTPHDPRAGRDRDRDDTVEDVEDDFGGVAADSPSD